MTRNIFVPAALLAVFKDKIFRFLLSRNHIYIGICALLRDGIHSDVERILESERLHPSEAIAFVAGMARGGMGVVVVGTMIHKRPFAGSESTGICCGI